MSRTTLCAGTAGVLAVLSVGLMIGRYQVLGDEVKTPRGPRVWKVTLLVKGTSTGNNAKLKMALPLDFDRQHIRNETFRSPELLAKPLDTGQPDHRQVLWTQRAGFPEKPLRAHYEFYCEMEAQRSESPSRLTRLLYAPPQPGEHLKSEPLVDCDHEEISALARDLVAGREGPGDQVEALFHFVDQEIGKEPGVHGAGLSARECLHTGSGDARAKSRLLVALCRNRGIHARMVTGLRLANDDDQNMHFWAEAWVRDHWLPLCPFHHHYGRVPSSYLVIGFGDVPIVRSRNVRDLHHAFMVERTAVEENEAAVDPWPLRRVVRRLALDALPPPEQRLVEFLLLLPVAALIVCLYRNVIGIESFGTFAPALVGLAFRELHSMPGMLVFASLILLGWGMRRLLDHYHLLQVPRTAFMLSLVVAVLVAAIVAANFGDLAATRYITLFPLVILTGMIERFWTLEAEDGAVSSFRTMLGTMLIAGTISLVLGIPALVKFLFRFPEMLGLIMACQLLLGRYTGYRLSELYRFQDFVQASGVRGQ